jgi:hypothetical protein
MESDGTPQGRSPMKYEPPPEGASPRVHCCLGRLRIRGLVDDQIPRQFGVMACTLADERGAASRRGSSDATAKKDRPRAHDTVNAAAD